MPFPTPQALAQNAGKESVRLNRRLKPVDEKLRSSLDELFVEAAKPGFKRPMETTIYIPKEQEESARYYETSSLARTLILELDKAHWKVKIDFTPGREEQREHDWINATLVVTLTAKS